eukprot:2455292-Rhodomonas_salina.1
MKKLLSKAFGKKKNKGEGQVENKLFGTKSETTSQASSRSNSLYASQGQAASVQQHPPQNAMDAQRGPAAAAAPPQPQRPAGEPNLSPQEKDKRLDACINSVMDFLANEGLEITDVFKQASDKSSVDQKMATALRGEEIDFVALNDPGLSTAVLWECLTRMSVKHFPDGLLDTLADYQRQHEQLGDKNAQVAFRKQFVASCNTKAVSQVFVNLLGLLNLMTKVTHSLLCAAAVRCRVLTARTQHSLKNGATTTACAEIFGALLMKATDRGQQSFSAQVSFRPCWQRCP